MWKLFTGIMGDKLFKHLEEEKGCRRNSRGIDDYGNYTYDVVYVQSKCNSSICQSTETTSNV